MQSLQFKYFLFLGLCCLTLVVWTVIITASPLVNPEEESGSNNSTNFTVSAVCPLNASLAIDEVSHRMHYRLLLHFFVSVFNGESGCSYCVKYCVLLISQPLQAEFNIIYKGWLREAIKKKKLQNFGHCPNFLNLPPH